MDEILAALDSLQPMDIEAVKLFQQRATHAPDADALAKAADYMQTLHETCQRVAEMLHLMPPVPLLDAAQVEDFSL